MKRRQYTIVCTAQMIQRVDYFNEYIYVHVHIITRDWCLHSEDQMALIYKDDAKNRSIFTLHLLYSSIKDKACWKHWSSLTRSRTNIEVYSNIAASFPFSILLLYRHKCLQKNIDFFLMLTYILDLAKFTILIESS